MHRQIGLLLGASSLALAQAQLPQITPAPKIIPKRGIEIHQDYGAPIGVDTDYLAMDGSSTVWIGINKEYLTEIVSTTTIDNIETTTTVKQQLAVVTATEASEGIDVGDVTVLMADTLQDQLDNLILDITTACSAPAKLKKRDATSCMIEHAQAAAQNEETLALMDAGGWDSFMLDLVDNPIPALADALQVLTTQALRNKIAIIYNGLMAAGAFAIVDTALSIVPVPHKLKFDDGKFGNDPKEDDDNPETPTSTQLTTTTSSGCDPSATVDENSPACDDDDCQGENEVCKAEGERQNCPCVLWSGTLVEGLFDTAWADEQQKILQELESGLPDIIPPQCFRNTYGDDFDGNPKADPSAFCYCSSAIDGGGMSGGTYPTMTGEGDDACTYATMPAETISITMAPMGTDVPVTSCRLESSYDVSPYCTCNDNSMHGQITTTYQGQETTVCPDATATMTEIEDGSPTEEPTCYPTIGPPHDNPDYDQLMSICNVPESELVSICRNEPPSAKQVRCSTIRFNPHLPIFNNYFLTWIDRADDAPPECDQILGADATSSGISKLCLPVFSAIKEKCPWTGGEASNRCGTFKYQSCPNDKECAAGSPLG